MHCVGIPATASNCIEYHVEKHATDQTKTASSSAVSDPVPLLHHGTLAATNVRTACACVQHAKLLIPTSKSCRLHRSMICCACSWTVSTVSTPVCAVDFADVHARCRLLYCLRIAIVGSCVPLLCGTAIRGELRNTCICSEA